MKLKVGDLVRVRYPTDAFFAGEEFLGFITATKEESGLRGPLFDTMWCITTGTEHILNKFRDEIEVLSK